MKTDNKVVLYLCASALALAGWSFTTPVLAQSTPDTEFNERADDDEIVVTGTSIRGVAAVGSPTVTMSVEDIQATGAPNLAAVSRTLPVVLNIGPDESRTGGAQDAAANSTRISAINLRGLGPEATLLLVNGRRMAPGGILRALSDPSILPSIATGRLEVVLDGSSAIYGADAVAGVVNIITRSNFNGAETSVRYGWGDGFDEKQFGQNFGRTWATGDIFAAFEYYDRSNLARADRPILSADLRPYGGLDQRSTQAPVPNIVVSGTRLPLPTLSGPANRYDGMDGDFLPHQERFNYFLSVRQEIIPTLQLWYEGFYSDRTVETVQGQLGGSFRVPSTNPFYVNGVPGLAPGAVQTVEYRLQLPNSTTTAKESTLQHSIGARWDFTDTWQLNAYYTHSVNEGISGLGGTQINNQALPAALADSDPATALNVYGGPISAAAIARVIAFRHQITDNIDDHFEVKLDGPLFSMAGGQVRAAFGASYHEGSFRYQEYQSALSPTNTPSTTNDGTQRREISSVFGEVFIPLFSPSNALPFIQRLDVSIAGRYDDYSDFGETFNPKISVVWDPIETLSLRGSWGESFRAPSLVDTGNLNFAFIADVPDPANGNALITQLSWNGSNPNLQPEEATTYSLGFDWRPMGILDGLTVSATYYNVLYENRIQGLAASLANEAIYQQFITRDPPDDLIQMIYDRGWLVSTPRPPSEIGVLIDGRRNNVGAVKQDGVDLNVQYRFDTDVGIFTAGISHSEILTLERKTFPNDYIDTLDRLNEPLSSRGRANFGWQLNAFSANLFYNYGGSFTNTGVVPNVEANAQRTFDLNLAYRFLDREDGTGGFRVAFNVQNLTDEDPPIVLNGTNAWDNTTASALGRFFSIQLTKNW